MVVPVLETALWANVELDSNPTRHLSLVGMLAEIDLALFLDDMRLLAENARLRFHLARHFLKHLCTFSNGAITASTAGLNVSSPACSDPPTFRVIRLALRWRYINALPSSFWGSS